MDPVSMMVAAWLGQWATEKIAEVLLGGVTSPLKAGDLGKALKKCATLADKEIPLFYSCEPRFVPGLLDRVFKDLAVEELQKPLKNEGIPNLDYLVHAFKLALDDRPQIKSNIKVDLIQPWLQIFVNAYFQRSQEYLRFQVAKADYFEQLANWFDDVKFAGISVPGQEVDKSAQLAHIFVMPDVVEEGNPGDSWFDGDFSPELGGSRQGELLRERRLWTEFDSHSGRRFNARQLLSQSQSKKVVLLGAPGVGKTTLLSYFAVMLAQLPLQKGDYENITPIQKGNCENLLGLDGNTDWLPILIKMRDWVRQPDLSILDYAKYFAEKTMSVKPLPQGFFEYWLEDGRALILLDGLDEVAQEAKRYNMVRRIENFLGQFHQNRAIITSRPAGYKRDFFKTDEFPHYELQSFDDSKIEEFINRWYDSRVPDKAEAIRRKDSLRKALAENDRITLLARNPLLLTIIALIHRYQALLPRERYKLYDKAVETLLTSWDANKEISDRTTLQYLRLDDLQGLMESLAYWIHTQGGTGDKEGGTLIDKDELIEQLARDIKTLKQLQPREAKNEAKRFVEFMRERTGLLNEQGQDCYAFVHKTFQEYLTAQYIKELADNEDDFDIVLNHIRDRIHDQHWREVLLLLIAQQKQKKAARAIQTVLDCGSEYEKWLHRDLLFAGSCLAENPKNLNIADKGLSGRILEGLVDLEVADSDKVGERVKEQVFKIICRLNESDFEAEALKLLKARAGNIYPERLLQYRAALGEKEAVIAHWLEKLQDQNSDVRSETARALVRLRQDSEIVVNALILRLEDEVSSVRAWAARALGELGKGSETVVDALLLRLEDDNFFVRLYAVGALDKLGQNSDRVVNALLLRFNDLDSNVRAQAVNALGKLGQATETIVNTLLLGLGDEDSYVNYETALALSKLGQNSDKVVNALILRLDDRDSNIRARAALALAELGQVTETIVNTLLLGLGDKQNPDVRVWATNVLSKLGQESETVVNALLLRLDDEYSEVRYRAAIALAELGQNSEMVVNTLRFCLDDEDSDLCYQAAIALAKLEQDSETVVNILLLGPEDQDIHLFDLAANVLGKLGQTSETVVNALLLSLDDPDYAYLDVAPNVWGKLGKTSSHITPAVVQWLEQHQDSDYIRSGIDALWDLLTGE
ncbi:HEAT repeat domain-containing protein [Limnofasciculus baicalensis]|uniref:HEAT repeat domain-containing protein n=1 Tax=Limnofasciculus baicalensis BBK-W-15 TaxID=2699891 RepID=A0AAE3KKU4_9CYAN|nr:HEAT repeat domain-containing protein [Limnofasciculus baicalensis]MCP2727890.1 HEAT repeat domain-containing protein [Limnofasciculus baicalensis BBK-W-15]